MSTIYDRDYGVERTFRLYDEHEIMSILEDHGLELIETDSPERLGGLMFFTDPKMAKHCVLFARKVA